MPTKPVTDRQRSLIEASFKQVEPIADQAAALFYMRLFELDPALKALFPNDLTDQGRKLMRAIGMLIRSLDDLPKVTAVLTHLGEKHVGYGAEPHHYGLVGEALLWTLDQGLGDSFDDETEEAWATLYGVVSGVMCEAAARSVLAKSA